MSNFETIDSTTLDSITGGNRGRAAVNAGKWLWRNVVAPIGGGAAWEWASRQFGGGQQPQQPQQPQQGQR